MPRITPLDPETHWQQVLGKALADARRARGLSQSDLAELIDHHLNSIKSYEAGIRSPSWPTFMRIAKACDVPPSVLMSRMDHVLDPATEPGQPVQRRRGAA